MTLHDNAPRVDLALIASGGIDWATLEDLDKEEGDDRIVAEALFAKVSDPSQLTIFSYDLRPRAAGERHGLRSMKPPEHWIYEPEPSPAEKDALRLKQRVRELEATQPEITATLALDCDLPIKLVRVAPLSDEAIEHLTQKILRSNPRRIQPAFEMLPDYGYNGRYDEFEEKVQGYGRKLPRSLERLFNQISFALSFGVEGGVGANHIDVQLHGDGATLHNKLVLKNIMRPRPPIRELGLPLYNGPTIADLMSKVARHEVAFDPKPNREPFLRLACEDFRQGRSFGKRLYAELDPRGPNPAVIQLVITAANLKGNVERTMTIPLEVEEVEVTDLMDLDADRLLREYRLQGLFHDLVKAEQTEELEA
jgi:hypothetical protein